VLSGGARATAAARRATSTLLTVRYALLFALAAVGLTAVAVLSFDRISATALAIETTAASAPADTVPGPAVATPVAPSTADYDRYAAVDKAWRDRHARLYSARELRARGDGRRTPRQAMQDRVFAEMRRGSSARAISELERWVRANPRDEQTLLTLARLLNESGRTDDALARYRQILALQGRRPR
jgi:tetratricopeptide (TPR) repeat protein